MKKIHCAKDLEEDEIYCICRKRERGTMIACDNCDEWFHLDCAGIKKDTMKDPKWYCFVCDRVKKSEERQCNLLLQLQQGSKEAAGADQRVQEFERLSEELRKKKEKMDEELKQVKLENECLSEELKQERQKMKEELRQVKMKNENLSEENIRLSKEINVSKQKVEENERLSEVLKQEKHKMEEELRQVKMDNESLSEENERLSKGINVSKQKVEEFQKMKKENEYLSKQLTDAINEVKELKKDKKRRLSYSQQLSQKQTADAKKVKKYIDDE